MQREERAEQSVDLLAGKVDSESYICVLGFGLYSIATNGVFVWLVWPGSAFGGVHVCTTDLLQPLPHYNLFCCQL